MDQSIGVTAGVHVSEGKLCSKPSRMDFFLFFLKKILALYTTPLFTGFRSTVICSCSILQPTNSGLTTIYFMCETSINQDSVNNRLEISLNDSVGFNFMRLYVLHTFINIHKLKIIGIRSRN